MVKLHLRSLVVLGLLAIATSACARTPTRWPEKGAERPVLNVPGSFLHSRIYVVPVSEDEVVLVDSGVPEDKDAVARAVGDRKVVAILLTHGHVDHAAGVTAWPGVPVYIHAADVPRLLGKPVPGPGLPPLGWRPFERPTRDAIRPVVDGQVLHLGDAAIEVIHLPGHTAGSVAYRLGDLLFSGDALLVKFGGPFLSTWFYSESVPQAFESLRRLEGRAFTTMFDGHAKHPLEDAPAAIEAYLAKGLPQDPIHGFVPQAWPRLVW